MIDLHQSCVEQSIAMTWVLKNAGRKQKRRRKAPLNAGSDWWVVQGLNL
jgi:hypothetical protein